MARPGIPTGLFTYYYIFFFGLDIFFFVIFICITFFSWHKSCCYLNSLCPQVKSMFYLIFCHLFHRQQLQECLCCIFFHILLQHLLFLEFHCHNQVHFQGLPPKNLNALRLLVPHYNHICCCVMSSVPIFK